MTNLLQPVPAGPVTPELAAAHAATYRKLESLAKLLKESARKSIGATVDAVLADIQTQLQLVDMSFDEETVYDSQGSFITKTHMVTFLLPSGEEATIDSGTFSCTDPLDLLLAARDLRAGIINDQNQATDAYTDDSEGARRIPLLWDAIPLEARIVIGGLPLTITKNGGSDIEWDWDNG